MSTLTAGVAHFHAPPASNTNTYQQHPGPQARPIRAKENAMVMTQTPTAIPHPVKTSLPKSQRDDGGAPLATFLGLFSIGLGAAELAAPATMEEATGVRHRTLLQAYGAREIIAGLGILANRKPAGWLWARVAGDFLDLATLAAAYAKGDEDQRRKAMISAAAVAGVTALDILCAAQHS
jgi:hypothetical protein